jgi:hypothetical protein
MTSLRFQYSRRQSSQRLRSQGTTLLRPSRISLCEAHLTYFTSLIILILGRQSFPPESLKPIIAIVFTQAPEHLVCFRFQSAGSCIFVIYDPHSRSEHPSGPAFILASNVDTIVAHFHQLLTQPSISQPTSEQNVIWAVNPLLFKALVIESRENSSTIDRKDLLTRSVAYLSEKVNIEDHLPSTLDLGTPVSEHLEQLRVRAEILRTQNLADAAHKQNNNEQANHTKPPTLARKKNSMLSMISTRCSEFGWQLSLQLSGTAGSDEVPKNDKDLNLAESPLEIQEIPTTDLPKKKEFGWTPPGLDGEDVDIPLSNTSKADRGNISDATISHMRSRPEFGWQIALQQPLKTDKRRPEGGNDLKIKTSTLVPQADIQIHEVLRGGEKGVSGEVSATLREEEEPVASSSLYPDTIRLKAEEEKTDNAVASSSSSFHAKLGQNFGVTSTHHYELDLIPLPSIPPILTSYLDAVQRYPRGFTTLEQPTSKVSSENRECGVCNESYNEAEVIQIPTCTHSFCEDCLYTFIKTKISEGRYPIF